MRGLAARAVSATTIALTLLAGPRCAAPTLTPRAPTDLSKDERQACDSSGADLGRSVLLAGVDGELRSKIEIAVRKRHVVALHVENKDCNLTINLLECTRPAGYLDTPSSRREPTTVTRRALPDASRNVAGAATLLTLAQTPAQSEPAVRVEPEIERTRSVSWWYDLVAERMRSRFGPMRDGPAPTLFADELEGPECSRATHWAHAVDYGRFAVRAGDATRDRWNEAPLDASMCMPKPCFEPIGIRLVAFHPRGCTTGRLPDGSCADASASLRASNGLALLRSIEAHQCPEVGGPIVPGKPTLEATRATRMLEEGAWNEAAVSAARVVKGETGDDLGNRWSAEYVLAVAYARLHHDVEANGLLSRIALTRCHPLHDEASFWMTVLERRALR